MRTEEEIGYCVCPEYQFFGNNIPNYIKIIDGERKSNNLIGRSDLPYPNFCCGKCGKIRRYNEEQCKDEAIQS